MLNIIETVEAKVYVTSDPHLGHDRDFVWGYRGYSCCDDHTEGVIKTINDTVRPNDILFMLGDHTLNTTKEQFDAYLDRINCRNFFCLFGNHNNPHEKSIYRPERDKLVNSRVQWVFPVKYKNMTYMGHYAEVVVNGQLIVMCHYPFRSWISASKGSWCLCGHEHGQMPETRPEATNAGKILDVGWDVFKRPISFSEIKEIMDKKPICQVGHH
jgi:calcineurin-like phosphoesterase family protein